jgi:hypothetical protein
VVLGRAKICDGITQLVEVFGNTASTNWKGEGKTMFAMTDADGREVYQFQNDLCAPDVYSLTYVRTYSRTYFHDDVCAP